MVFANFSNQPVEAEPSVKPELRWRLGGHGLKANDAAYVKTSKNIYNMSMKRESII